MSNYFEFIDTEHLYGYCACPTAVVNEQIAAGQHHRYHLTVIQPDGCDPPLDNCAWLITYEMSMDQVIDYIRQNKDHIISFERLTNEP
jgi:hypothetical protein